MSTTHEKPDPTLDILFAAWPVIGMGATYHGYSDSQAHTVVAVSATGRRVTLRRDKATLLNGANSGEADALHFSPGGFCGHTSGTQRWSYAPDPDGATQIASLTGKGWRVGGLSGAPVTMGARMEHYDFNF